MGVGKYAKAIVGSLVAGLGALQAALGDGLTAQEGIGAGIAALVALGAVWAVPNSPTVSTAVIRTPGEPATTVVSETK